MSAMAGTPEMLTYAEAAARFGVSPDTIRNWVARGYIKKYRKPLERKLFVSAQEIEQLRNAPPKPEPPEGD